MCRDFPEEELILEPEFTVQEIHRCADGRKTWEQQEAEAWEQVKEYEDWPMWRQRRYLTKRQRWLLSYFKGKKETYGTEAGRGT